jgi:hypothetical protein
VEREPRVVDLLNQLLKEVVERRWTEFTLQAGAAPSIEGKGPWEDETIPAPEPLLADAMIARLADLAKLEPKGAETGKGRFGVHWDRATLTLYVTIEKTAAGRVAKIAIER